MLVISLQKEYSEANQGKRNCEQFSSKSAFLKLLNLELNDNVVMWQRNY